MFSCLSCLGTRFLFLMTPSFLSGELAAITLFLIFAQHCMGRLSRCSVRNVSIVDSLSKGKLCTVLLNAYPSSTDCLEIARVYLGIIHSPIKDPCTRLLVTYSKK